MKPLIVITLIPYLIAAISPEYHQIFQQFLRDVGPYLNPLIIAVLGYLTVTITKRTAETRLAFMEVQRKLDGSQERGERILANQEGLKGALETAPANVLASKVLGAEDLHNIEKVTRNVKEPGIVPSTGKDVGSEAENYPVSADTDLGQTEGATYVRQGSTER